MLPRQMGRKKNRPKDKYYFFFFFFEIKNSKTTLTTTLICRLLYKLTLNFYSLLLSQLPFSSPFESLGTLSKDDDDGSENVTKKKWICVLWNLIASVWTRSVCQIQAIFPGVRFLRIIFKFKKRKENSSSYVHVLHKASN